MHPRYWRISGNQSYFVNPLSSGRCHGYKPLLVISEWILEDFSDHRRRPTIRESSLRLDIDAWAWGLADTLGIHQHNVG